MTRSITMYFGIAFVYLLWHILVCKVHTHLRISYEATVSLASMVAMPVVYDQSKDTLPSLYHCIHPSCFSYIKSRTVEAGTTKSLQNSVGKRGTHKKQQCSKYFDNISTKYPSKHYKSTTEHKLSQ